MLIRPPATASEFEAYYTMRWKILREPWDQPPGSEKDEFEGEAIHLGAWTDAGKLLGVGRLHSVAGTCGQIRYMAVDRTQRSQGVGQAILRELENQALGSGLEEIRLNSRQDAVPFYEKNGYQVLRPSHILYGAVPHFEMRKQLR